MVCVIGPDTIMASENYLEVRKEGNPPCNAEDKSARWTPRHWSQVQGLPRESWTKGSSGVRRAIFWPDSWTMMIHDRRLRPVSV